MKYSLVLLYALLPAALYGMNNNQCFIKIDGQEYRIDEKPLLDLKDIVTPCDDLTTLFYNEKNLVLFPGAGATTLYFLNILTKQVESVDFTEPLGAIIDVKCYPEIQRVVCLTDLGKICFTDYNSRTIIAVYDLDLQKYDSILCYGLSPDYTQLVSVSRMGTILIIDFYNKLRTKKRISGLGKYGQIRTGALFFWDQHKPFCAYNNQKIMGITVVDLETLKEYVINLSNSIIASDLIASMTYNHNLMGLIIVCNYSLFVIDPFTGGQRYFHKLDRGIETKFSDDGLYMISCNTDDGSIKIYDSATDMCLKTIQMGGFRHPQSKWFWSCVLSPRNNYIKVRSNISTEIFDVSKFEQDDQFIDKVFSYNNVKKPLVHILAMRELGAVKRLSITNKSHPFKAHVVENNNNN